MTLFELVKQTIHVRDAAEHYGLQAVSYTHRTLPTINLG